MKTHELLIVAVCSIVTIVLRFLPFVVFRKGQLPKAVVYLGKVLPSAIMAMLVIFCYRNYDFTVVSDFLPAVIAGVSTVLLYVWKRNTMISIFGGTVLYMLFVQFIF